jgi:hypothetical protein
MEPCNVWQCGNLASRKGNFHGQVECFQKELASVHNSIMVMLHARQSSRCRAVKVLFYLLFGKFARKCSSMHTKAASSF